MRIITSIVMTAPSLLLIVFFFSQEYWGRIYGLWGLIYAAISFILMFFFLFSNESNGVKTIPKIFSVGSLSWVISFAGLAIINFSPLCLGQNNGDGHNSLADCVLLTLIWPVFNSIFMIPLILFASWISHNIQLKYLEIKEKS